MATGRKRLGEMLVEAGVIDTASLTSALAHQRQWGVRLGQALVELRIATEKDIVHALSRKLGFDVAVLDGLSGREFEAAKELVPREFAAKNGILPMADDGSVLAVAMSDPMNVVALDELSFRTGRKVKVSIAGDRELAAALRRYYGTTNPEIESIALDESDDSETTIMPLLGQQQAADEEAEWRAPPSPRVPRHTPMIQPAAPEEASARTSLLGAVPRTGFDVERTAEVALRGTEVVTDDILEPEPLEDDAALTEPAAAPAPPSPAAPAVVAAAPEEPSLPSRAAAAVAAVAARGGEDPELADAARVLAAVVRVLVRKALVTDQEIAEELRTQTPAPRAKGPA